MEFLINCGVNILENENPEMMEKINKLREERNEYTKKAYDCQTEIDNLYKEMANVNHMVGMVIDVIKTREPESEETECDAEACDVEAEYLLVKEINRQFSGVQFGGDRLKIFSTKEGYKSITFCTEHDMTVKYANIKNIKFVPMETYNNMIETARKLIG